MLNNMYITIHYFKICGVYKCVYAQDAYSKMWIIIAARW